MSSVHSEELVLLSYLDGELDPARSAEVRSHLDVCEECRQFLAETELVLRRQARTVRGSLPAPPNAWADLRPRLNDLDAERLQTRRPRPSFQPVWWAAAAAGVAIAVMVMRLSTGETVSAAELLAKASVNEVSPGRLHIRSSNDRSHSELAAMFREANFDWDRPLRAGAFAEWRNSLAQKKDDVRILQNPPARKGQFYKITTSTPEGGLREVSVTIRAADLRAVEERFQFRNSEWVEIREAVDDVNPVEPSSVEKPDPSAKPSTEPLSIADEVRVFAALHRIGADLGEPIEVHRREDAVEVVVLGAAARREKEIREALSGIPHVVLRFEQPQAVRSSSAGTSHTAPETPLGPIQSRLLRLMGSSAHVDTFTNSALETSEAIMARAHALRQLSERFPQPNDEVRAIASDHVRVLRASIGQLEETLNVLTGELDEINPPAAVDARGLLGAAQRLDTLLSLTLASPNQRDDPNQIVVRLRRAASELKAAVAGYQP